MRLLRSNRCTVVHRGMLPDDHGQMHSNGEEKSDLEGSSANTTGSPRQKGSQEIEGVDNERMLSNWKCSDFRPSYAVYWTC